ncbi:hypothetical protein [Nocardioides panaciterrulae]|uniref:TIR domain-containing protein n=1 Tax=Nocardioides panaciterrulae TaxID=661492 RepID=A0A7Y9JCA8_9ACTN|nr:hypothetical protein [Nocardioides panaciterrulae]NYD43223.1 hypothetical protein [Nocardioides panaciterrulae]
MAYLDRKHAFVSYVTEDKEAIDGLRAVLEAAQIPLLARPQLSNSARG